MGLDGLGVWTLIGWVAIFGTLSALIGPRKGKDPKEAFFWGAILGIFGLALLAIQPDDPLPPKPLASALADPAQPTRVKVYQPGQEAYFRQDQADAAANGWHPVARDFTPDGSLRVTYRKQGRSEWAA